MTPAHRTLAVLGLAALAACGGGAQQAPLTPLPTNSEATVEAFLVAVNAGDLERMASLWGDEQGPSNRTNKIPLEERQRRLTIVQRVLRHDEHRLVRTDSSITGRRVVSAELVQSGRRFTVPFVVVQPSSGQGWLVREIGLEAAMPTAGPRQAN